MKTLKSKLLVAFLGCGLIPVFGLGSYFYWQCSKALEEEAMVKLEAIMKLKAKAVENYFALLNDQVLTFSHNEGVKAAFRSFNNGFKNYALEHKISESDIEVQREKITAYYENEFAKEYKNQNNNSSVDYKTLLNIPVEAQALQYAYIANNSHPLGEKHKLDFADRTGEYNITHALHHPNFREYLEKFEFYDIFLIDGETGNLIYSVFKELDYGTSLRTGPYKDSGLARVFEKAMAVNSESEVVMEDYSTYRPSYDGPAGFLAAPIWINGEKKGVVAFQISFDKINSITLEKTSDDKTLETFLVGSDFKMRSDSLLDKEHLNVKSSFKYPEKGTIKSEQIKRIIEGGALIRETDLNYLGSPSVITGMLLDIFGNKWAITTQISEEEAFQSVQAMKIAFLVFILAIALFVSLFAIWFANRLSVSLLKVTEGLRKEANTVSQSSQVVSELSERLSEATTEQASSLQETVASINEIAAMISRNADSAASSAQVSERSTSAAQKGKDKVEQMLQSIHEISRGNDEIIEQVQVSNREISEIVKVIEEISTKTQVINDIVFQTKLLSFNASVEAARAGEHGKGFAVVAEEVGNLASMSGKAATEISDMLSSSVKRVVEIVDKTKTLMDNLVTKSKEKIEFGTATAKECAESLDDILGNVSSVNEMIREIATASQEQSLGVKEVNKAMSELDQVTQNNSDAAHSSSEMAGDLRSQAERLNSLVNELSSLVNGQGSFKKVTPPEPAVSNILKIEKPKKEEKPKAAPAPQKVANSDVAPSHTDDRFEDV